MRSILDLLLPHRCAGCGAPAALWCSACAATLRRFPVIRPGLTDAHALSPYHGPARRAVLAYKERGRRELASALGAALAAALPEIRAGPYALVPAPSRPAAARARHGQHMAAVAAACAEALPDATVAPVLTLSGGARDSLGLNPAAREANLRGRIHCAASPPRHAVLIDDVITTGATATTCRTALLEAGAKTVTVLTLTATT
jgi:predicted amidophosphoribosyltransferase